MTSLATLSRGDYRVRIIQDSDQRNPRSEFTNLAHALTIDTHLGNYIEVDPDGGPLEAAWKRVAWNYKAGVDTFERYARIYHGATVIEHRPARGAVSLWYLTAADIEEHGIENPEALIRTEISQYQAWADGEVYSLLAEKLALLQEIGKPEAPIRREWNSFHAESGLYGIEYATEAANDLLDRAPETWAAVSG
ncbi:hypothetical protein AB0D08_00585 [Kitasatospora sp. NPDC048540]|uniref:hypothetical protein n=1 Tax=Kitasatospora sp. NPDC048540 TaxID=3155634 RepID=UPI00340BA67D